MQLDALAGAWVRYLGNVLNSRCVAWSRARATSLVSVVIPAAAHRSPAVRAPHSETSPSGRPRAFQACACSFAVTTPYHPATPR
ncbi:MAG: hypothetical protein QOG46_359 [Pseudonocardiales bacterium]|nr:hypothetical protein [Pseudonocardiales bacterium]